MKSLRKILKTSTWNVSDLVRSPLRRTLSWGKTSKISTKTPSRNWIVYDLRRHFHQLFRQLQLANHRSHKDVHGQDLGHFDNLLKEQVRVRRRKAGYPATVHHLRRKCIDNLHHGSEAHEVDNVLHGVPHLKCVSRDPDLLLRAARFTTGNVQLVGACSK